MEGSQAKGSVPKSFRALQDARWMTLCHTPSVKEMHRLRRESQCVKYLFAVQTKSNDSSSENSCCQKDWS